MQNMNYAIKQEALDQLGKIYPIGGLILIADPCYCQFPDPTGTVVVISAQSVDWWQQRSQARGQRLASIINHVMVSDDEEDSIAYLAYLQPPMMVSRGSDKIYYIDGDLVQDVSQTNQPAAWRACKNFINYTQDWWQYVSNITDPTPQWRGDLQLTASGVSVV